MIEGDGQYAVVPTNRPRVDRAFRYAARGWVRLESGTAQLKILYFDGNGRYIGENRSGQITRDMRVTWVRHFLQQREFIRIGNRAA